MMCVCHNFRMINIAFSVVEDIRRVAEQSAGGQVRRNYNGRTRRRITSKQPAAAAHRWTVGTNLMATFIPFMSFRLRLSGSIASTVGRAKLK